MLFHYFMKCWIFLHNRGAVQAVEFHDECAVLRFGQPKEAERESAVYSCMLYIQGIVDLVQLPSVLHIKIPTDV